MNSGRSKAGASLRRNLILASASPRRKELLAAAGFEIDVIPPTIEERQRTGEPADEFVRRMAREKAHQVLSRLPPGMPQIVLGADTVVAINDNTLGKPASYEDAAAMLRLLSGCTHRVLTAVCLLDRPDLKAGSSHPIRELVEIASTEVTFSPLSEEEIRDYVATGEPFDKAGAYAIQGRASKFVVSIEGCYFNVVGLPVSLVYRMLQQLSAGAG